MDDLNLLQNLLPQFTHIVNRISTPSWKIDASVCPNHNIILIYEGEAIFSCNNSQYKAVKGDLIYFQEGDTRYAYTFPDNLMKCYAVDFIYTCPIFKDNHWELTSPNLPFKFHENIADKYLFLRLQAYFEDMSKLWLSGSKNRMSNCRSIFINIMTLLIEWKCGNDINYDKIRKVEKVIDFMTSNYNSKLSLETLANVVNVSTSYLGSIFREVTGISPVDYLINIRMSKAKELILDGNSITQTSNLVGFTDVFYFSKYFKKYEGISPSQYMKKFN